MTEDLHNEMGELLSAYLDDELTPEERARVEARIATDADARALLSELRAAADAVRALPHDAAPPEILDAVSTRLERDALLAGDDQDVTLARHRRSPVRATLAVAAMLAVVVGGGLYVSWQLSQDSREQPTLARNDSRNSNQTALEMSNEVTDRGLGMDALTRRKEAPPRAEDEELLALRSPRAGGRAAPISQESDDAAEIADADVVTQATEELFTAAGMTLKKARQEEADASSTDFAQQEGVEPRKRELAGPDAGATIGRAQAGVAGMIDSPASIANDGATRPAVARTFEQRLAAGERWDALVNHDLANEPLQLTVHFRGALSPDQFADRVIQRLTQRGAASITVLATASAPAADSLTRTSLVQRTIQEAANPQDWLLYMDQPPHAGTAPDAPRRQVLARMPADWLVEIIDEAAAADARAVALRLGEWTASSPEDARNMAELALAAPRASAPAGQSAESKDVSGWLGLFGRLALPGMSPPADAALGFPSESKAESASASRATRDESSATTNGALLDGVPAAPFAEVTTTGLDSLSPASAVTTPRLPRAAENLVTVVLDLRADPPSAAEPQP